jgi:hypothetical protein
MGEKMSDYRRLGVFVLVFLMACGGDDPPSNNAPDTADAGADVVDAGTDADVFDAREDTDAGSDAGQDFSSDYFGAVRGIRDMLRESPDHLNARAGLLAEQGEAEQLFDFVRSEIALLPHVEDNVRPRFEDSATAVMSGPRGALRSGAGTMRDRAELLAHLYREAGWEADVVGPLPDAISREDYEDALFSPVSHSVEIPEDHPAVRRAEEVIPVAETNGSLDVVEPDVSRFEQMLLDEIPVQERGSIEPDTRESLPIPIVRLTRGDEVLHLDVISPDASFVDIEAAGDLEPIAEADYPDIRVRVSMTTTRRPDVWTPLMDHVWQSNQLEGRQINLRFQTSTSIEEAVATPRESVQVATPIAIVDSPELDTDESLALSALGTPFTIYGQTITEGPDGTLELDGIPITDDEPVGPVDQVEALDLLEADPDAFNVVRLRFNAEDSNGAGVSGLGTGAFEVYEDGERVGHVLGGTEVAPLRVLLLTDTSGSVGGYWKDPAFATHLGQLVDSVQSEYPGDVEFAVANVDDPFDPASLGPWSSSGASVENALTAIYNNGSPEDPIWDALVRAARLDHDVTVVISDAGDENSGFDPSQRILLENGPPALLLGTGGFSGGYEDMVEFTNGESHVMETYDDADQPLADWVSRQPNQSYQLVYYAPVSGPDERSVEVRTSDGRVSATTSYTVPPPAERSVDESILGVRLDVTVDGRRATRLLAGIDPANLVEPEIQNSPVPDVQRMTMSEYVISVESQAPTFGQWYDDYLTMRLTQEDLFRAHNNGDADAGLQALKDGYKHVDPRVFTAYPALDEPYASEQVRSYATGPRVAILSKYWSRSEEAFSRGFDILPVSRFVTRRSTGLSDFEETFRQTARFAAAETANFDESTETLLDGEDLLRIGPGAIFDPENDFTSTPDAQSALWWRNILAQYDRWHRFVPADGQTRAFWVVHQDTGEMYGILPDGTGGAKAFEYLQGYEQIKRVVQDFDRVATAISLHPAAGSTLMIAIIEYFKALVRLYAVVTVVLINLDAQFLDDAVKAAMLGFTCNFIKSVIFAKAGDDVSAAYGWFSTISSEYGISDPLSCPDPFGA